MREELRCLQQAPRAYGGVVHRTGRTTLAFTRHGPTFSAFFQVKEAGAQSPLPVGAHFCDILGNVRLLPWRTGVTALCRLALGQTPQEPEPGTVDIHVTRGPVAVAWSWDTTSGHAIHCPWLVHKQPVPWVLHLELPSQPPAHLPRRGHVSELASYRGEAGTSSGAWGTCDVRSNGSARCRHGDMVAGSPERVGWGGGHSGARPASKVILSKWLGWRG